MSDNTLKRRLIAEIQREERREGISDQEYTENDKIFEELRKKNLKRVTEKNKTFQPKKIKIPAADAQNVSSEALEAYTNWKKVNCSKRTCPEVSVKNLLLLIHYLNAEPHNNKGDLHDCLRRQSSDFEIFWDSPAFILEILRQCILKRDWSNMTYFSLILLNYDKKYIQVVRNMCRIMVKFNPLVKTSGLEDQFNTLTATETGKLTLV